MAFNSSTASVSGWLGIAPLCGLPASRFVPASLQSQAATVAARHVPPGAPSDWVTVATASLIARGIIYFKNAPGDCGLGTQIQPSETTQIGQGISAMAGAALPGIGPFLNAIVGIFGAAHNAAVANEQATICQVASIINQVFAYYDQQVILGNISASNAYTGMQSYLAQVNEQLQTIEKKCNAACVYQGILAAHADFVQSYYPAIAPIVAAQATAPGQPIVTSGPGGTLALEGAPGGAPVATGGGVVVNALQPVAAAAGVSTSSLALILVVLVALFAIGWAVL